MAVLGALLGVLCLVAGAFLAWGAGYALMVAGVALLVTFLVLFDVDGGSP